MKSLRTLVLVVPALACLIAPITARAQRASMPARTAVEAYLSRYHLYDGDSRLTLDALGGRLMWSLGAILGADPASFASRTAVGGFVAAQSGTVASARALHYGAQIDVRALPRPVAGIFEPVVSLGVGAFKAERPTSPQQPRRIPAVRFNQPVETAHVLTAAKGDIERSLALSPAIGVRALVAPGFGVRGDVRKLVRIAEQTEQDLEISAGISVSF